MVFIKEMEPNFSLISHLRVMSHTLHYVSPITCVSLLVLTYIVFSAFKKKNLLDYLNASKVHFRLCSFESLCSEK